jgi:RsiW-degrading membrane proteinase PrsW (M82 family)
MRMAEMLVHRNRSGRDHRSSYAGGMWRWLSWPPRWLRAGVLVGVLSAVTFLTAELSHNWTIAPTAVLLGALAGPFALAIWITDRTRVGRSVPPDLLFATFLVGGGVAILFTGFFESAFFYPHPSRPGYFWIGFVEETAKVIAPLAICMAVPRYRSVEQALALAIVSAGGFAVFESMTFAITALDDKGARHARAVLLERTFVTPFGHIPWTSIAVVVAASAWQAAGRIRLRPKALWGLGAAIALHTVWNLTFVEGGWWHVLVPVIAAVTFLLFWREISGVFYAGTYAIPADHYRGRRPVAAESTAELAVEPLGGPDAVALVPPQRRSDRDRPVDRGEGEGPAESTGLDSAEPVHDDFEHERVGDVEGERHRRGVAKGLNLRGGDESVGEP